MSKITVKHYLNRDLNPRIVNNEKMYQIYVQVFVLGKSLKFKSTNNYFDYLSEAKFANDDVNSLLSREREDVTKVINSLIVNNKTELITSKNIGFFIKNPVDVINQNFCKFLVGEQEKNGIDVPEIILSASYSDINELITFFNNPEPINGISEDAKLCFEAIGDMWLTISRGYYLVYDFFFGETVEQILSKVRQVNPMNAEKSMQIIQRILSL